MLERERSLCSYCGGANSSYAELVDKIEQLESENERLRTQAEFMRATGLMPSPQSTEEKDR